MTDPPNDIPGYFSSLLDCAPTEYESPIHVISLPETVLLDDFDSVESELVELLATDIVLVVAFTVEVLLVEVLLELSVLLVFLSDEEESSELDVFLEELLEQVKSLYMS